MKDFNLLISAEITEEVEDLIDLAKKEYSDFNLFVLVGPAVDPCCFGGDGVYWYRERICKNFWLRKLYSFIYFMFVFFKVRPSILLTGFSMVRYRFFSKMIRVKHISYLRGLLFDPANISGISDFIKYKMFGFELESTYLFNAYEADCIYTIAAINKDFLVARGISPEKIILQPPVWLNTYK